MNDMKVFIMDFEKQYIAAYLLDVTVQPITYVVVVVYSIEIYVYIEII